MKFKCPCCGFYTFEAENESDLDYDYFCNVCKWMYESDYHKNLDFIGGNHISLGEARENYKKYGYCDEIMKECCRPPREDELPKNNE